MERTSAGLLVVGGAVAGAALAAWASYPAVGRLAIDAATARQTRRAGLRVERARVGQFDIEYATGGPMDAATVVLLHGFTADRHMWDRFAARLVGSFRVVAPDLPGHGRTAYLSGAGYSAPAQADRVVALMDRLGIDQAHILGNSMGGFIAAHVALRHPRRTLTLGLCDAAGVTQPEDSDLTRQLRAGHNPFVFTERSGFDAFFSLTVARPPTLPRVVRDALAQEYVDRHVRYAQIFDDFAVHDAVDDALGQIAAPTLVLWGDRDRLIHVSAAEVWASGIPDARAIIYPGVGHLPIVEVPDRSAADYLDFLRHHPATSPSTSPATSPATSPVTPVE